MDQLQILSLLVYQLLILAVNHVPAYVKVAAATHVLFLVTLVLVLPVKSLLSSLVIVLASP